MTFVFLSIRTDMVAYAFVGDRERMGLLNAPVGAGEHVGPALGIGRELDLHGVGILVDDFVDMAGVATQRAAHQRQLVADPGAGGRRRRVVAERIVPEQFVGPVVAVVGED